MQPINVGYVLDQLARAGSPEKRERFERVLRGMADGSLAVGSRTPVAGTPAWVTLEVAHGGFATGAFLAGGAFQPHETALAARLGARPGDRGPLNAYFLSSEGQGELREMLASGRYRVQLPEEGALLTLTWLLARDRN